MQSHFPGWKFQAPDTVANWALHGTLLLWEAMPMGRIAADPPAELASFSVELSCNGEWREVGQGSNVPGSSLAALEYLDAVLEKQPQLQPIQAGEIVSTGTITTARSVRPGELRQSPPQGIALDASSVEFVAFRSCESGPQAVSAAPPNAFAGVTPERKGVSPFRSITVCPRLEPEGARRRPAILGLKTGAARASMKVREPGKKGNLPKQTMGSVPSGGRGESRKRRRWKMLGNTLKTFLKMVSEDEKLRAEFFDLAHRHGIEMAADELSDAELEKVTGGTVNLYVKVADIRGEAQDDKHKDEIEVLSY